MANIGLYLVRVLFFVLQIVHYPIATMLGFPFAIPITILEKILVLAAPRASQELIEKSMSSLLEIISHGLAVCFYLLVASAIYPLSFMPEWTAPYSALIHEFIFVKMLPVWQAFGDFFNNEIFKQ